MKFDFKKYFSRKFLVAVVGVVVGLAIALGADSSEITQIAGAVTSAVSAISYIFGEAMVDAAAASKPEVITIAEEDDEAEKKESNEVVYY